MRVNVYGEELTDRIEVVSKTVVEEATGEDFTFYGLRFWLKFPNQPWWVHRKVDGEEDDDSSALTIWAPTKHALADLLDQAFTTLNAPRQDADPSDSHASTAGSDTEGAA